LDRRLPLSVSTTPYTVRRLVSRSAEETLVQSKLLSLVGCRPWRRIAETLEEWSEASEVGVPRDQRDASLAARRSDECVIKERRLFVKQLPTLPCGDGRENTTALNESRAGRCKHTLAAF